MNPETPADAGAVLVVDDSALVRRMIGDYLRNAGYQVEEAEDGAAAIQRLSGRDFDVVVTDLQMPKLGGFELMERVKTQGVVAEVIVLTGTHADDVAIAVRALRLGAHDFLTKPPPSAEAVVFTVQRAIEKKRLRESNQRLMHQLESLSRTDSLTGALNRRVFDEVLPTEVTRAGRHGYALSLLLMDLDNFKAINDGHGHLVGDAVLRQFVQRAAQVLRAHEPLYRYGGEEFAAVLPHTPMEGGLTAAQRVVTAIASTPFTTGVGPLTVSVSVGVACGVPPPTAADLLGAADAALYTAKQSGRNRAVARST
jgi:diguanylate cyclase (GGDEF)-like protein